MVAVLAIKCRETEDNMESLYRCRGFVQRRAYASGARIDPDRFWVFMPVPWERLRQEWAL